MLTVKSSYQCHCEISRRYVKIYSPQPLDHSSHLYEIIIDYLLILAKVTPKQCPGAILMSI